MQTDCSAVTGIQCTNKLSEISDAVASSDCALVAQKYIGKRDNILLTLQNSRKY